VAPPEFAPVFVQSRGALTCVDTRSWLLDLYWCKVVTNRPALTEELSFPHF